MAMLRFALVLLLVLALLPWGAFAKTRFAAPVLPMAAQGLADAGGPRLAAPARPCRGPALPGTPCALPVLLPSAATLPVVGDDGGHPGPVRSAPPARGIVLPVPLTPPRGF